MDVKEVVKMQHELDDAREKAKSLLIAKINNDVTSLALIGFEYELVPKSGETVKARICSACGAANHTARNCPKKEAVNGTVQKA